jgi:hypothetical protein
MIVCGWGRHTTRTAPDNADGGEGAAGERADAWFPVLVRAEAWFRFWSAGMVVN